MPKETFFHLKPEKREKIEEALIHEFSRGSFEEASISHIVLEAKIPRGSFYQYFEDKEDAIKYIIQKFLMLEHKKIYHFLIETQGNLFETSLKIYDYMVEQSTKNTNVILAKNILQELRKSNINIFDHHDGTQYKEQTYKILNQEILNLEKEEEIKYMMKILTIVTRTAAVEVITKKITQEEGRKELIKQLEILKKGMQK
ncbi:MAG: TetR/AcrR family transcriptional regulator [Clostridia bacterium]|nr:TetR/AcrR family transcriptional regulator [Clostridia bacterium]